MNKFYYREERLTLVILLAIVLLKALFITGIILYAGIGLGPDEAQYWTWSQKLAAGYYSKPPGIAWQIWFGTKLFGNTEFGVRFGSLVLGSLLPFAVYVLARTCKLRSSAAFLAALAMALTPLGFLATFFSITDVGCVLFWTLTLIALVKGLEGETAPNYGLVGLLIGIGALFKWQIYWLWVLVLILNYFYKSFRSKAIFLGLFISLIGLLPSAIWNISHDFATFRHVFSTMKGAEYPSSHGNFFDFIGAQAALISPILFVMLLASFWQLIKPSSRALTFLGWSCFVILALHALAACFQKIQGNWCDYAYPAGFVFLAYCCSERWKRGVAWFYGGIGLSLLLTAATYALPWLQKHTPIPYKISPFRHNVGWDHVGKILENAGYQPARDFLFASTYQMTSILSFYGPSQERAYFFNLQGVRKNQFSYWPEMVDEQKGQTGYFVVYENGIDAHNKLEKQKKYFEEKLKAYFKKVVFLGIIPIFLNNGKPVKQLMLFCCEGYNGLMPLEVNKY